MADANIGALPKAPQVDDESLLVMEQQGQAMSLLCKQIKDYAKQGLELNFKEDVDAANDAADRAVSAVSAVTEMTVDAHASDTATVKKSMQSGKVNLSFGLPRGEQGPQGDIGPIGPRGPQGNPGNGLTILGHYDTEETLRAAVTSPEIGDSYSVGLETPYDTYIFDGVTLDWKNYGPFTGDISKSGVTSFNGRDGDVSPKEGDYTADMVNARPNTWIPTADEVSYNSGTVADAISQLFISGSDAKALISSAVSAKGVPTAADDTWQEMADNIRKIETGSSTGDATATPGDILAGKTAYVATGKVEGIIPSLGPMVYTPGVQAKQIANGQYLSGTQIIQGDTNLTSANIRKDVSIFGVDGEMTSTFQATLTVTVDIGAVVTATHTNGTKVEALCTTGKVALELPIEGQWTVTAQRGVAQYNSAVIIVSSQYAATLTSEIHIIYSGPITGLSEYRSNYAFAATSNNKYAIFGGGYVNTSSTVSNMAKDYTDAYDANLTKSDILVLSYEGYSLAAASLGEYSLFSGGFTQVYGGREGVVPSVTSYDTNLTSGTPEKLSQARGNHAGTNVGKYILFGGGRTSSTSYSSVVDSYNEELTRETEPGLASTGYAYAASNENYAIFFLQSGVGTAYSKDLTRTTIPQLTIGYGPAARAGNYVVFGGTQETGAYDMFLTYKSCETKTYGGTGTTIRDYALFGGTEEGADVYDILLTKTTVKGLPVSESITVATSIGDYAIFGDRNRKAYAYMYV